MKTRKTLQLCDLIIIKLTAVAITLLKIDAMIVDAGCVHRAAEFAFLAQAPARESGTENELRTTTCNELKKMTLLFT